MRRRRYTESSNRRYHFVATRGWGLRPWENERMLSSVNVIKVKQCGLLFWPQCKWTRQVGHILARSVSLVDYTVLSSHFINHCIKRIWIYLIRLLSALCMSDKVLGWLSICSEVQMTGIRSSWCHCHPIVFASSKSRLVKLNFLVPAYPRCPEKEAVKRVSISLIGLHTLKLRLNPFQSH